MIQGIIEYIDILDAINVKNMAKSKTVPKKMRKGLNSSTQNTGTLARFTQFLTYKAELMGKKVIKIDESFTSKCCANCDKMHDMMLSDRIMICDCGNHIDRDRNSAINIMKRYLSQEGLWTAHSSKVMSAMQSDRVDYKDESLYLQETSS